MMSVGGSMSRTSLGSTDWLYSWFLAILSSLLFGLICMYVTDSVIALERYCSIVNAQLGFDSNRTSWDHVAQSEMRQQGADFWLCSRCLIQLSLISQSTTSNLTGKWFCYPPRQLDGFCAPKSRRRVRWGTGKGVISTPTTGCGERRELPSGVQGITPTRNAFWCILKAIEHYFLHIYADLWVRQTVSHVCLMSLMFGANCLFPPHRRTAPG